MNHWKYLVDMFTTYPEHTPGTWFIVFRDLCNSEQAARAVKEVVEVITAHNGELHTDDLRNHLREKHGFPELAPKQAHFGANDTFYKALHHVLRRAEDKDHLIRRRRGGLLVLQKEKFT